MHCGPLFCDVIEPRFFTDISVTIQHDKFCQLVQIQFNFDHIEHCNSYQHNRSMDSILAEIRGTRHRSWY